MDCSDVYSLGDEAAAVKPAKAIPPVIESSLGKRPIAQNDLDSSSLSLEEEALKQSLKTTSKRQKISIDAQIQSAFESKQI